MQLISSMEQQCDLDVSEGSLCMKEAQVVVLCPKIQELDGDFGDVLGWSFFLIRHDAWMYHLMCEVKENHKTGQHLIVCSKLGVTNIEDVSRTLIKTHR